MPHDRTDPVPTYAETPSSMRDRAKRMRALAPHFTFGDAARHLREFADELEKSARARESDDDARSDDRSTG
jgi:hypothetical protein